MTRMLRSVKVIFRKLLKSILIWIRAVRAPFFTASIAPVLLGTSISWYQTGIFHGNFFCLALIGVIFAHAGTNMLNDYFDHLSGNDELNKYYNQFSGGSRVMQNGIFSSKKVLVSSFIAFLIVIVIGLYLNSILKGNILLWIGFIGVVLGITYSASPFKLSYRGIGEVAVALGFGVVVTLGSFFVQTQKLSWLPVIASIPTAILVGLILFINEFQDSEADGLAGKKTVIVRVKDKRKAIFIYQILLVFAFVWIIVFFIIRLFPIWTLLTILLIPWVIWIIKTSSYKYNEVYELLPVNASTIGIHFIGTLLLSVGFLLGRIF